MVQRLRLCTSTASVAGLIPGQATKILNASQMLCDIAKKIFLSGDLR